MIRQKRLEALLRHRLGHPGDPRQVILPSLGCRSALLSRMEGAKPSIGASRKCVAVSGQVRDFRCLAKYPSGVWPTTRFQRRNPQVAGGIERAERPRARVATDGRRGNLASRHPPFTVVDRLARPANPPSWKRGPCGATRRRRAQSALRAKRLKSSHKTEWLGR